MEFLLGSSLVAVLIVQVLKELLGKLEGRFGKLLTQVILLAVSFAIAGIGVIFGKLSPNVLETTGTIFAISITIYEVLYKAIYKRAINNI